MALSLVKICGDHNAYFINEGENYLFLRHARKTYDLTERLTHGIFGLFHSLFKAADFGSHIPSRRKLKTDDRILLCSDGIVTWTGDYSQKPAMLSAIKKSLRCAPSIYDVPVHINDTIVDLMSTSNVARLQDDYTMLALEVK
jgi:hypothetical protein